METLCQYVVQCRMCNVPFFLKYRCSCSGTRIDSLSLSEIESLRARTFVFKCMCLGVLRSTSGYYLVSNTLHSGMFVQETGNKIVRIIVIVSCFHFVNHTVETSCLNLYIRLLLLVLKTENKNFRNWITLSHTKQTFLGYIVIWCDKKFIKMLFPHFYHDR